MDILRTAVRESDERFDLHDNGDLEFDERVIAEVEVNYPGEEVFIDEIAEMVSEIEVLPDDRGDRERVLRCLSSATAIVAVRVLHERDWAAVVWSWAEQNREGLLQFDDSGFADMEGLILDTQ